MTTRGGFRERDDMPLIELRPSSGRYLPLAEREEIALLQAQQLGVREIAPPDQTVGLDGATGGSNWSVIRTAASQ